jgi:hypothetical protein
LAPPPPKKHILPAWVLLQEGLDNLMATGAGAVLNNVYARRGVSADHTLNPDSFDLKNCSLIIFKTGFGRDLGYNDRLDEEAIKSQISSASSHDIGDASSSCASPSAAPAPLSMTLRPTLRQPSPFHQGPPLHCRPEKTERL